MSYILDALKKSESERQRQQAAGQPRADVARAQVYHPGRGRLWRTALLLAGTLLVGGWWFAGNSGNTGSNGEKAAVAAPRPVPEPASEQDAEQGPATDLARTDGLDVAVAPTARLELDPSHLRYENVPFLWELPAASAERMRAMNVTIHVYARGHSGHILFINDRKYHQGERTPEGARVESIVERGVIMSYQGQYFKLSRPR